MQLAIPSTNQDRLHLGPRSPTFQHACSAHKDLQVFFRHQDATKGVPVQTGRQLWGGEVALRIRLAEGEPIRPVSVFAANGFEANDSSFATAKERTAKENSARKDESDCFIGVTPRDPSRVWETGVSRSRRLPIHRRSLGG